MEINKDHVWRKDYVIVKMWSKKKGTEGQYPVITWPEKRRRDISSIG